MQRRARQIEARVLPRGWGDVLRQLSLFVGAYLLYQLVRGLVDGNDVAKATWNAYKVINLEQARSTCSWSRASRRGRINNGG